MFKYIEFSKEIVKNQRVGFMSYYPLVSKYPIYCAFGHSLGT